MKRRQRAKLARILHNTGMAMVGMIVAGIIIVGVDAWAMALGGRGFF